jgi:uncharacterized protein related to proFAR isomerase
MRIPGGLFIKIRQDRMITPSGKKKKIPRSTRGFLKIPAISILNGRIVTVQHNKYRPLKIDNRAPKPDDFIERLADELGYQVVYINDINGIKGDSPQLSLIRKFSEVAEVWIDPGVTFGEHVIDFFVAGAERVVVGSKTVDCVDELKEANELSENIMFGLDVDHGKIVGCDRSITRLPLIDLVNVVVKIGIRKMVFTDLGRIGSSAPFDFRLIRQIVSKNVELYVGGGVNKALANNIRGSGAKGALLELNEVVKELR